ncbi:MAG TPA: DUF429 domain-containing protein [Bacillota bacterium]|nr:DUF429 domain-containing protein [Bacillota bacterium]
MIVPDGPRRGLAGFLCGIDVGSLRTPSYVAWLREGEFTLDMYVPSERRPLPAPPAGWPAVDCVALDAPQGLPTPGEKNRHCDRAAGTPTNSLPGSRPEMAERRLYAGLVEAGVSIFWWVHTRGLGRIAGFSEVRDPPPVVCETYPRFVLRRLGLTEIPSKRKTPVAYVDAAWGLLRDLGYRCPSVVRPCDHQVDAMLCAVAAEAWHNASDPYQRTVGVPPIADVVERLIYEGYIVAP